MRSVFFKSLLVTLVAGYAGSAFALFDVQVLAGKRWYEIGSGDDKANISAQEFDVAAHLSPIPLVPVSFGVSANVINLHKEDFQATKATGFQAGLDFQGWLPFVPVITPYARLSIPLVGTWAIESNDTLTNGDKQKSVTTAKVSGYRLAVGGKYELLPVLSLLFEAGRGMEKFQITELKVDGDKQSDKGSSENLSSNTFMLGIEMGL